jgi:predicted nuclease of restriction endonuclease-like (RecB) superfamily
MTNLTNINKTDLFANIKKLLNENRNRLVQTVNTTIVQTYFEIGKLIVEDEQKGKERAEYGKYTLENLSKKLTKEFGKGFSIDNLENMRKLYLTYQKSETLSRKLSWSHYIFLIKLDQQERKFYEIEAVQNNWSLRELQRQFNSSLYERIALSKDKKKVLADNLEKYHSPAKPQDIIKDPYILEFLGLEEKKEYSENELETAVIDKIESFLLELGKGFAFMHRQKRISFNETHFFIDLVFYNRLLKCFVLVDLKIGKIKHQDLGQMHMYVNYYDRFVKEKEENPTIGIVLCKDKDDALVEMTLPEENNQIYASKYKLYLPTKEQLREQIKESSAEMPFEVKGS